MQYTLLLIKAVFPLRNLLLDPVGLLHDQQVLFKNKSNLEKTITEMLIQ